MDLRGFVHLIPLPYLAANPYSAITDWLNFTFDVAPFLGALDYIFGSLFEILGPKAAPAEERKSGRNFYEHTFRLGESGAEFSYGGNRGTALISLSGEACALVKDWNRVIKFGCGELKGRISRWDGAIDDYLGLHTVDAALALYIRGQFGAGGRQPTMKQYGNWARPDGTGRSIVIGKREHGKRLEVYEKGMQLGQPWHPWVRWETCIGNQGRKVPWDVLLAPGQYAVGAYPNALSWADFEASRIATLQKQTQIGYDAMVRHISHQYGPALRLMREVEGSADKVLAKLERSGTPKRLQHPAIDRPPEWLE